MMLECTVIAIVEYSNLHSPATMCRFSVGADTGQRLSNSAISPWSAAFLEACEIQRDDASHIG